MTTSGTPHGTRSPSQWTTIRHLDNLKKGQQEIKDTIADMRNDQAHMMGELTEVMRLLNSHLPLMPTTAASTEPNSPEGMAKSPRLSFREDMYEMTQTHTGRGAQSAPCAPVQQPTVPSREGMQPNGSAHSDPDSPQPHSYSRTRGAAITVRTRSASNRQRSGSGSRYYAVSSTPYWLFDIRLLDYWTTHHEDIELEFAEQTETIAAIMPEETRPSGPRKSIGYMKQSCCRWTVMHPNNSGTRNVFDLLSLVVLLIEFIVTPYTLAWDLELEGFLLWLTWFATIFWSIDIVLNFFTGFRLAGEVITSPLVDVMKHYAITWFPVDVIAVTGDILYVLLITISGSAGDATRFSRIFRIVKLSRFLRLLGLVRMLRVIKIFNRFMESRLSEAWRLGAKIVQMSCALLWFAHLAACIWYGLGEHGPAGSTGEHWVDTPLGVYSDLKFSELSFVYQYSTVYQWAVAQITLGAHDVVPTNSYERIFTVLCNLFGLVFGGTLVSVLSTSLLDFRETHRAKQDKLRMLRLFLHQHGVNTKVATQVLFQVEDRMTHSEDMVMEESVDALDLLSMRSRADLRFALFGAHLKTHNLFRYMDSLCLEDLCCSDIKFEILYKDDELFVAGKEAQAAYYIKDGQIKYLEDETKSTGQMSHPYLTASSSGSSEIDIEAYTRVSKGSWLSEAAWWVNWVHAGTARAVGACKLIVVSPDCVAAAVSRHHLARKIVQEYAECIKKCIVEADVAKPPNDVAIPGADFLNLVPGMRSDVQKTLGLLALEQAANNGSLFRTARRTMLRGLEQEVRTGKCVVWLDQDGGLRRVTAVTVLQLEQGDTVFAQLAKYDHDNEQWQRACWLPGSKQESGELPLDAIRRLFEKKLAVDNEMWQGLHLTKKHNTQDLKSEQYGIHTRYIRTVYASAPNDDLLEHFRQYSYAVTWHAHQPSDAKRSPVAKLLSTASSRDVKTPRSASPFEKYEELEWNWTRGQQEEAVAREYSGGWRSPHRVRHALDARPESGDSFQVVQQYLDEVFLLPGALFAWIPWRVFYDLSTPERTDEDVLDRLLDRFNKESYMMVV